MDPASEVLAQGLPPDIPRTWAALSNYGGVPLATLYHRGRGRRSRMEQARSQQYLTPEEEKAIVRFLLLMSDLGQPIRIKFISSLAFIIGCQRSTNKPTKPLNKNWPRAFEKRHPELKARKVKAID